MTNSLIKLFSIPLDDQLFNKTVFNSSHTLHTLLPPPSAVSQHYNLRRRTHAHSLPQHDAHLCDCNFLTRMLYKVNHRIHFYVEVACGWMDGCWAVCTYVAWTCAGADRWLWTAEKERIVRQIDGNFSLSRHLCYMSIFQRHFYLLDCLRSDDFCSTFCF